MGRRSRTKRKAAQTPREGAVGLAPRKAISYPGARVARVSVDDETWSAFRELCGPTPASVRLGELVAAEVERCAREASEAPDALAAVRAIHDHVTVLESYVRASKPAAGSRAG
jgi:hypothetical protein